MTVYLVDLLHSKLIYSFLVTPEEPITGVLSEKHCFLRTSEFTNNPRINQFVTGVVTYKDDFAQLGLHEDPLVKVN